ncbi:MAG: putative transcriptional regulator [Solirubrobacteraceae bacterium]|jgi:putative transcriptional regulator|nr:putative transcriptional regulator [Solirubrobacteraceae bacterium]MEA2393547.1 putative transcriptional regulator [Solirubrobacteraceae bacterium]
MAASLKGQLIIASPSIHDPNFRRTVIYMTEHGDEGAMGLILNRAAQTTVGEAVPDLAWLADAAAVVHVGGPVAPQSVVVLAEFKDPAQSALLVDDDLGFVPAEVEDPGELAGALRRARVFAGHAGWGPGQLEAEMEEESWIVEVARRDDVFTADPDDLWSIVLRRKGDKYALMATMPMDPSLN